MHERPPHLYLVQPLEDPLRPEDGAEETAPPYDWAREPGLTYRLSDRAYVTIVLLLWAGICLLWAWGPHA